MTSPDFLIDGPARAAATILLAHGAGAAMDSPFLQTLAEGLAARGLRVVRFEFPFMAARREGAPRRPPDRQAVLLENWRRAVNPFRRVRRLVIGGKSLGGRMASLVADEIGVSGLVCLGYPFHPPGRRDVQRTAHLEKLETPTLILQGSRDPFGNVADVAGYRLSPSICLEWVPDGDHSFSPRRRSGRTQADNLELVTGSVDAWVRGLDAATSNGDR